MQLMTTNTAITMTSLEMVEYINSSREAGEAQLVKAYHADAWQAAYALEIEPIGMAA